VIAVPSEVVMVTNGSVSDMREPTNIDKTIQEEKAIAFFGPDNFHAIPRA
jgi:hypothetical protein